MTDVVGGILGLLLAGACWRWWHRPAVGVTVLMAALLGASAAYPDVRSTFLVARWGPLFAMAAVALLHRDAGRPPRSWLVFLGIAGISCAWSIEPDITLLRTVALALVLFVSWRLGPVLRRDRRELLLGLVVVGLVTAVASVVAFPLDRETTTLADDLRGVLENANALGLVVALTYLAALPLLEERRAGLRWALGGIVAAAVLLGLTGGRSGMLLLLVALPAYELVPRRLGRLVTQLGGLLAVFLLLSVFHPSLSPPEPVPGPEALRLYGIDVDALGGDDAVHGLRSLEELEALQDRVEQEQVAQGTPATPGVRRRLPSRERATVFGTRGAEGQTFLDTLSGARLEAWEASAELVGDRPVLGYGFGTGDRIYSRYEIDFVYFQGANPANTYVQLGMELGLLAGLAGLAAIIAAVWAALIAIRRRPWSPPDAALGALVLGLAVAAMAESLLTSAGSAWTTLFWVPAGAVLAGKGAPRSATASVSTR